MNPTKLKCRGSGEKFPFRLNSRFYSEQGRWYFSAREGVQGPFNTREEAEIEAMMFIRSIVSMDCFGLECERRIAS
jgi:hypothetical protein